MAKNAFTKADLKAIVAKDALIAEFCDQHKGNGDLKRISPSRLGKIVAAYAALANFAATTLNEAVADLGDADEASIVAYREAVIGVVYAIASPKMTKDHGGVPTAMKIANGEYKGVWNDAQNCEYETPSLKMGKPRMIEMIRSLEPILRAYVKENA